MIDILFYVSGIIFFSSTSFMIWKAYLKLQRLINMEAKISLPPSDISSGDDISRYRERLINARVKTEDELNKMTAEEIKKLYLKSKAL